MKQIVRSIFNAGLFLFLSISFFIQCSPKEKSQLSEKEWDALPDDGPALSSFERVFFSSGATESERYAAQEFARLFKEFTGKELAIDSTDSQNGKIILIGADASTAAGLQANTDTMGEEGFSVEIAADKIAIYGGRPRGTLYGVYEFFEK